MEDDKWSVRCFTKKTVGPKVFAKAVDSAIKILGKDKIVSFTIVIIGDSRMRVLNKRYRQCDRTTDVLSFSYLTKPSKSLPNLVEGDIMISLTVAQRQAKSVGHSLVNELNRLFVHGLLHLAGYDHEIEKDAVVMRGVEDEILGINKR